MPVSHASVPVDARGKAPSPQTVLYSALSPGELTSGSPRSSELLGIASTQRLILLFSGQHALGDQPCWAYSDRALFWGGDLSLSYMPWLRHRRLIGLVVAPSAIAHQVEYHVLV